MSALLEKVFCRLEELGQRPKRERGQIVAYCPQHERPPDGHSPSLSVGLGDNGGLLVFCHGGCETPSVVAAMGWTMADLMPEAGNGGSLHRLGPSAGLRRPRRMRTVVISSTKPKTTIDFGRMAARFTEAVEPGRLHQLAAQLGLSVEGLARLGVGWSADHRAWTFPMKDRRQTVGIRLRSGTGRKWAVSGSREGLFIPSGLTYSGRLLIAEGPTDTAALLDLGYEAVGRPSCTGGVRLLVNLVRSKRPTEIAIVSDVDSHGAGQRGAESLATALLAYCSVRVVMPPLGIKDIRKWRQAGATRGDVAALIEGAPPRRLSIVVQAWRGGGRKM